MIMIEKIEKAIDNIICKCNADDRGVNWTCEMLAKAALEAMVEPTIEMKRGLIKHRGYDPDACTDTLDTIGKLDIITMGVYIASYEAMIKAALEE